jgi:hypothetical protein
MVVYISTAAFKTCRTSCETGVQNRGMAFRTRHEQRHAQRAGQTRMRSGRSDRYRSARHQNTYASETRAARYLIDTTLEQSVQRQCRKVREKRTDIEVRREREAVEKARSQIRARQVISCIPRQRFGPLSTVRFIAVGGPWHTRPPSRALTGKRRRSRLRQ